MALLGGNYEGEESTFEPIPPGEYPMQITASSMEPTKDNSGKFLKLEMEIIDGAQAGRKLTDRLNLENRNAQAVEIAQRSLRSIIFACGLSSCTDSDQLHMRRMLVSVAVEDRKDQPGTKSNRIKGYKPAGAAARAASSASTSNAGQSQQPSAAATASGGSNPPWKR